MILFTGANLFMNCVLTCQLTRKGAMVGNRNPTLCKYVKQKNKVNIGSNYEDRENKIMMTNITIKMSFPCVFMMNSYSCQTSK